jgi:anti-sigma-K factor RskA
VSGIARPPDCGRDAAPYVLGALAPAEAGSFVDHMERCAVCRDEVAALAPVLDALPASAPAYPVPRALRRRVLRAVRREPKASRRAALAPRWLAAPAAATAAAAAVAVAVVLGGGGHPPARVIPASVGHAELRVTSGHGELIAEHLAALPANQIYELWLQSGEQAPVPSTLFAATSQGRADLGVPGDLHAVSRVLVTVEPRGGSLVPTTRPVIQVPLAYVRRS